MYIPPSCVFKAKAFFKTGCLRPHCPSRLLVHRRAETRSPIFYRVITLYYVYIEKRLLSSIKKKVSRAGERREEAAERARRKDSLGLVLVISKDFILQILKADVSCTRP